MFQTTNQLPYQTHRRRRSAWCPAPIPSDRSQRLPCRRPRAASRGASAEKTTVLEATAIWGMISGEGGIPTPLKNIKVNWDDDIPN